MNILVIPNRGRSYNAVRPEAECYISLAKAGHSITIMTCDTNAYYKEYEKANLTLISLHSLKKHSLSVIRQIHKYIKKHDIDIVYATESNGIPNAAFGCIGTKAKMVAYRGTMGGMYKTDPSNYLCTLHPRINGYICLSNAVKLNVLNKVRGNIKPNTVTIYKGHDLAWYKEPIVDLNKLGVEKTDFCVVCVGSAREHKGMAYMIEATKYLKDIKGFKLLLVGDGFDKEPYISQIEETGMSNSIIQTGFRNDFPQIAGACKLCILPSLREGLSRAILESLSYGTPVITSNCGGPTEVISDDYNGYVVPLRDAKAIAEKIRMLFDDEALLAELSKNAPEIITTTMSHQSTVDSMEKYFLDLCGKSA
ncbi:MAG: glycosyltransferase family 4 protein [Colwellia sp.]